MRRLLVATLLVATWGAVWSLAMTGSDWFHAPVAARVYLVAMPFIVLGVVVGRVWTGIAVGLGTIDNESPVGTIENLSRPYGTLKPHSPLPSVKTLGYWQLSLREIRKTWGMAGGPGCRPRE